MVEVSLNCECCIMCHVSCDRGRYVATVVCSGEYLWKVLPASQAIMTLLWLTTVGVRSVH